MVALGRSLSEVRLSPNGTWLGYVVRQGDATDLVIRLLGGLGEPIGPELVMTTAPRISGPHPDGGGSWAWAPDSSWVVFVGRDRCLWRLPTTGGAPIRIVEPHGFRPGVGLWSPAVSRDGRWISFVQEDETRADLAVVSADGGWPIRISRGQTGGRGVEGGEPGVVFPESGVVGSAATRDAGVGDFVLDPDWGPDGRLAWHAWNVPDMPWDGGWIGVAKLDDEARVTWQAELHHGSVGQPRWAPSGPWLAFVSDEAESAVAESESAEAESDVADADGPEGGWKNLMMVNLADPGSEDETKGRRLNERYEHADPTWGPGQRSFCWSPDGAQLAFDRNEDGFGRLCVVNESGQVSELGRGVHRSLSWSVLGSSVSGSSVLGPSVLGASGSGSGSSVLGSLGSERAVERIAAVRQGATTPSQIVIYERELGSGTPWTRTIVARGPVAGWESADLVEPTLVRYPALDGAEVFGRLYRPSKAVGPTPLVVSIHGGPTSQSRVTWNARFSFLISRGWSVFVPDHRGSTGWGRDYQQAMNERWGELDIDDSIAGIRSLVADGLVDRNRVVAMGGSAGGFTVLGLMGRYPDEIAGGIDLFGVADLIDLDSSTHRFEKHYQRNLVGPRPEREQRYIDRSPVTFAASITAPLLVMHGDADDSVVIGQSRSLVAAMQRAGATPDFVIYPDEGHGWRKPETTIDELTRIAAFLENLVPAVP